MQIAGRDIWHTDPVHRSGIGIETILLTSPHQITVLNHGRAAWDREWLLAAFSHER